MLLTRILLLSLLAAAPALLSPQDTAFVGARVYPSPTATPIDEGVVLIRDGRIVAVGRRNDVRVPPSAQLIDVRRKFLTAGFWNSHVHFTEDAWAHAGSAPAGKLAQHMRLLATQWGFTTVFDLGSDPANTMPLRKRVDSGEIPGPTILTTAGTIFPENGVPVYLPDSLAAQLRTVEAATPEAAKALATRQLAAGGDGIKVFTGAIKGHGKVAPMPADVARAAVEVAHAAGKPVFAHPSNHVGTDNALAAGVDVLAHTIPMEAGFTPAELQLMKRRHVALIPTLALFPDEERKFGGSEDDQREVLARSVAQVKSYFDMGGTILFGTDVGYTQLYDPTTEYEYMARAGMTWRDILASLTTNPAAKFRVPNVGEVKAGNVADLVVLDADPATDVRNFAKVRYTIRKGQVIHGS